jgi:hypothetical protein
VLPEAVAEEKPTAVVVSVPPVENDPLAFPPSLDWMMAALKHRLEQSSRQLRMVTGVDKSFFIIVIVIITG